MVTKRFWWVLLVMVLEMAVIGCDNGSTGSGLDVRLNGTWVFVLSVPDYGQIRQVTKLDNGNMEASTDGILSTKGTYTTSNGKLTMSITAVHGGYVTSLSEGEFELDSKWYSKNDLKTALEVFGVSNEDFEKSIIGQMFTENTTTYSVTGDTLTTTDSEGNVGIGTRK